MIFPQYHPKFKIVSNSGFRYKISFILIKCVKGKLIRLINFPISRGGVSFNTKLQFPRTWNNIEMVIF